MEDMKLTDAQETVHDNLDLIPFTDPRLSKIPADFNFELESPEHSQLTVKEATYPLRSTSHYSSVERSSSPSLCPQSRLAFKY